MRSAVPQDLKGAFVTAASPAPTLQSEYAVFAQDSESAFIWLEADLTRAEAIAQWVTRAFGCLTVLAAIFVMWV